MSERERYPAGVPCWVETLQPDLRAALDFYGPLFGWQMVGPGPMPGVEPAGYHVARVRGRDVAGIAPLPDVPGDLAPAWITHVRVDSADEASEQAKDAGGALLDGPFDVLPAGRMAVLADPAGAVLCAWEAGTREGAHVVNEPSAWAMSALHTADPEGAIAFYGTTFGWRPEPFGPVTLWRLPGYVGGEPEQPVPRDVVGVMAPLGPGEADPHWSVDFWVADADATADHAAQLGGRVVVAPHDAPGFRTASLVDPQGASFSISQLVVDSGSASA
jgi:predicted enzyme related to lactoylglutathione lyase